jgi:4-hydroxythreonine-4-phosphate dehydrogenase
MTRPRIGLLAGDPSGIGPEVIARLRAMDGLSGLADVLMIGDGHVFDAGQKVAGFRQAITPLDARAADWQNRPGALHALQTIDPAEVRVAEVSLASGRAVLRVFDEALRLVQDGVVDALVFAPLNKAALHLAGLGYDDEIQYLAARLGVTRHVGELNVLDGLWTGRVTSHIALRQVADAITPARIAHVASLVDRTLRQSGLTRPRIAMAALNPHAGDGGNFGREEIDLLIPSIAALAAEGMAISGPWPSDTVFLKGLRREIDAVVTMYHDQGQIALKLLGFDRGVTVLGGLPFPVTTPAHGSAFDIAGKGLANPRAMRAAFDLACQMVSRRPECRDA